MGKARLIPTHQLVGISCEVTLGCRKSFILWYELNADLAKVLPSRYATVYGTNYSLKFPTSSLDVFEVTEPRTSATSVELESSQHAVAGCRYLETCRISNGAVKESDVFPNPASTELTLKFILTEPRQCSFTLHYLNGMLASKLDEKLQYNARENFYSVSLKGTESGMYLLSMITDKGERIVQRIVVQK